LASKVSVGVAVLADENELEFCTLIMKLPQVNSAQVWPQTQVANCDWGMPAVWA